MNPAKYNRRITLQQKTTHTNSEGISSEAWTDIITVWAARESLRGREFFAAAAVQAEHTVRFRIRYREGVSSAMRILSEGKVYEIISPPIEGEGRSRELVLMCKEVTSSG